MESVNDKEKWVVGPLGQRITLDDLPPPDTRRWFPRLKAEVVAAVTGGLLTLEDVCDRYGLTLEEYACWQLAVQRVGIRGLRTTCVQRYRDVYQRQQIY